MWKWFKATPPVIGSMWRLCGSGPFDEDGVVVTIVAIRSGWVQYKFKYGTTSSLPIRRFRGAYREIIS